jgi:predicted Zn-dependent peptidase
MQKGTPMRRILPVLLLPLVALSLGPAPAHARQDGPFTIERFSLDNGMQVWVQPREDSQSVAAMLVFRVGSRYEDRSQSGISHFVEHMLFTGTERWSEDEIKTAITRRGGHWNGWTGYERTTYFAQVSAQDTELALDWLSEIAFRSTFPDDKVDKERGVIFQEKSGRYGWLINTLDSWGLGYELDRDLRRALYPGSSLGQRIIGEDDSLDGMDRAALLAYYQRYYTPANATLVLVGRVTPGEIRDLVARTFGSIPTGERSRNPAPVPSTPTGPLQVAVRGPMLTEQTTLELGARTVGRNNPDRWSLEVLGEMLGQELTQEIRYKRGLVYGLWAYNNSFDDTGYFEIGTTSAGDKRQEIQQVIQERLATLRAGTIDPQRVDEARAALVGRWALAMEDNVARASYLAEWTSLLDSGVPLPDYPALINAVTSDDLVRVGQRYFTPEASYVALHQPIITVATGGVWGGALVGAGALWWGWRRWRRRRRMRNE